jgi:hypothetical protein
MSFNHGVEGSSPSALTNNINNLMSNEDGNASQNSKPGKRSGSVRRRPARRSLLHQRRLCRKGSLGCLDSVLLAPTLLAKCPASTFTEGVLIKSTSAVWIEIARILGRDASLFAQLSPTQLEELVAGAYEKAGYRVILTPAIGRPRQGRDCDVVRSRIDQDTRIREEICTGTPCHCRSSPLLDGGRCGRSEAIERDHHNHI